MHMIFKTLKSVLALLWFLPNSHSRPNGSSICDTSVADSPIFQQARYHGPRVPGFSINIAASTQMYTPQTKVIFTLSGNNIGGLLFAIRDSTGTYLKGIDVPKTGQFTRCSGVGDGKDIMITHKALNTLNKLDITWTPGADAGGPVNVTAIVTEGGTPSTRWNAASMSLSSSVGGGAVGGGKIATLTCPQGYMVDPNYKAIL